MAFFNFFNSNSDKAIKKELARSFDTSFNNMLNWKGKRTGVIDLRLVQFPEWLGMEFIDEEHLNQLIAEWDDEMEKIPTFSVHMESKRVVPIDGVTTILAAMKRGETEIYGNFLTYIGDTDERGLWEQNYFATIDLLQKRKGENRTLVAQASSDEIAAGVLKVIDSYPILFRGSRKATNAGQVSDSTIATMKTWYGREGEEFVRTVIDTYVYCKWSSKALQMPLFEVLAYVISVMYHRNDDKHMELKGVQKALIDVTEGYTWSALYAKYRNTIWHNNGQMPGTKAMLVYCLENNITVRELSAISITMEKEPEVIKKEGVVMSDN